MRIHFYDWDEVIVLSKTALFLSYKKALQEWNIKIDMQYFEDFIYTDANMFLSNICNFSSEEIKQIKEKKEEYYLNDFFKDIIWNLPIFDKNSKYIIVTNTSEELVKKMLAKYDKINNTSISQCVNVIGAYCANTIRKRKPDPELYIEAFRTYVQKMNFDDELHIYEDSAEGLLAAASFLNSHKKRISKFYLHHIF